MFTMSRNKHCVYSFCTNISAFPSPLNRTIKSPKFQTQKSQPFIQIQPRLLWTLQRNYYLCDPLSKKITAMREINPQETTRASAFEMWMQAPNPMVTFFKTLDVSRLLKISRKRGLKFNMLMCYCIGRAASQVKEFYLLPVGDKLMQYDTIAVNTIVANSAGEVSSCDLPYSEDLAQFNSDYLRLTKRVAESCTDHDLSAGSMVIGTSALAQYEIDGAVGMYSGIFNNPFMIWGKYKRKLFKTTLSVSFQFHHTQMDGAHAAKFLDILQREIDGQFA